MFDNAKADAIIKEYQENHGRFCNEHQIPIDQLVKGAGQAHFCRRVAMGHLPAATFCTGGDGIFNQSEASPRYSGFAQDCSELGTLAVMEAFVQG